MFAIQNGSNLFQTQSVLFNGKRTVNSADPIGAAQIGVAGEVIVGRKPAGQL